MKLKYKLNSKNKFTDIVALAVLVLRCAFGVFNWRLKGIKNLQKTRKCIKCITQKRIYIGRM
jgi:hypothetical protein